MRKRKEMKKEKRLKIPIVDKCRNCGFLPFYPEWKGMTTDLITLRYYKSVVIPLFSWLRNWPHTDLAVLLWTCSVVFIYMVTIATKKRESERLTNGEIPFFVAEDSFDGVVEAGCLGLMSLLSAGLESCREALLSLTNRVCFLVAGSSWTK